MKRLGAAALVVAAACSSSTPAPVAIERVPRSYAITYRLENGDSTSTETVSVRRPFDGRVDIDGAVTSSSFGRMELSGRGSAAGVLAIAPTSAVGDVRIDIALADAMKAGYVTRLGRAKVAGRPCERYGTGGAASAATIGPGNADDGVVLCVDADGLLLQEQTRRGGKVVRELRATDVRVAPSFDDVHFGGDGAAIPVAAGGGSVQRVTDESRTPGAFWELSTPKGFTHRGRYAVVSPTRGSADAVPSRTAGVVDVYVRGVDVVTVERGAAVDGTALPGPGTGEDVAVGALGRGSLTLSFVMNEILVSQRPAGHYVRVRGTVRRSELLRIARAMHVVQVPDDATLTTVP